MSAVDVVVPCYNYGRFLAQCVDSVLGQTGVDVRVLVIDDASSDDSKAIGRALAARDHRVTFRRHSRNRGHIATYNEGLLEWASAPYCLLLSADDALTPGALARATELMDRHGEVGLTYGLALVVEGEGPLPAVAPAATPGRVVPGVDFLRLCWTRGNPVPTPTAVVRTALQHRVGGYRAELLHTGDMEMWMRLAIQAPVGFVDAVQAYYRRHAVNMSARFRGRPLADQREVLRACEAALATLDAHHPEAARLRRWMREGMAWSTLVQASTALDTGRAGDFRTLMRLATEIHPGIRYTAAWWRVRARQYVGKEIWQALRASIRRPVLEAPRGQSSRRLMGRWPGQYEVGRRSIRAGGGSR